MFGRGYGMGMRRSNPLIFIIFLVIGLFFVNLAFPFAFTVPAEVLKFRQWFDVVAGVMIIFGGISYLRAGRMY